MSGGKSDLCLSPQQLGPVPAPQSPLSPGGAGGFLPSTLNGRGLKVGGPGSSGGGEGSYSAPAYPHLILPSHPLTPAGDKRSFIFYYL